MTKVARKKEFSEAELQGISEPITITVHKVVGGRQTPVNLPPGPGSDQAGQGYTKDNVRELPVLLQAFGGGVYEIEVTGVDGRSMNYSVFFPTAASATPLGPAAAAAPGLGAVQAPLPASGPGYDPNYLTRIASTFQPPGPAAPVVYPFANYNPGGHAWPPPARDPWAIPSPIYPSGVGGAGASEAAREREERIRLEGLLARQEQQHAHEKQIQALRAEIHGQPTGESEATRAALREVEALKQQLAATAARQQNDQFLQAIKDMQAATDRRLAETERRISEAKPDPTMPLILQMMTQSQQSQQQSMQMIFQAMQAGQGNHDQVANAFGKAFELMASGVDSILQAQQPQMHPAVQILSQATEAIGGAAQRYLAVKETEAQAKVQRAPRQFPVAQFPPAVAAQQLQQAGEEVEEEEAQDLEHELFGPAHDSVMHLRLGVSEGKLTPDHVAQAIIQAIEHFASNGGGFPKVFALYQEQRFAEFVDALLPAAHHTFREQATGALLGRIEQLKRGGPRPVEAAV